MPRNKFVPMINLVFDKNSINGSRHYCVIYHVMILYVVFTIKPTP